MLSAKLFLFFACAVAVVCAKQRVGGNSAGDLKEAEKALSASLDKLAAGEQGPIYTVEHVNSASKQVVAGSLLKINADLKDQNNAVEKACDVSIWTRAWLKLVVVDIHCPNKEAVKRQYST